MFKYVKKKKEKAEAKSGTGKNHSPQIFFSLIFFFFFFVLFPGLLGFRLFRRSFWHFANNNNLFKNSYWALNL